MKTNLDNYLIEKDLRPKAKNNQIVVKDKIRITVLFPELIRVERSDSKEFTDDATQMVWYRDMSTPFVFKEEKEYLIINTSKVSFHISTKAKNKDFVVLDGKIIKTNNKGNLLGTCRTLDQTNGHAKLENGLISKSGVSVIKDDYLILKNDGMLYPRNSKEDDEYIFAFSDHFRDAINAFYQISGRPPLLPRYVFGNWWSRYYAYSDHEYLSLMDKFKSYGIPLSVACIDMDWHWVDVKKRFGAKKDKKDPFWLSCGWTGYTWNKELFSNYPSFLNELHERNLVTCLNLHPSQGVRFFEDAYPVMAKANDIDPNSKKTIPFDITSTSYLNSYFTYLHRPMEKNGVDFWWIDWQQGKSSALKGSDPLWSLNHYHFLESKLTLDGERKRPLIMSRYAGLGSHRYPVGFSGDTIASWQSLNFQPFFTANADNAGYTWWSHDLVGHMLGEKSNELYARWIELGCFSPTMRLHSTNNAFQGKEPWKYSNEVRDIAIKYLRFRHALIPYIYTMNVHTHEDGIALVEPLYYSYPKIMKAYEYPNEFFFGSELLVIPITKKEDKKTALGMVEAYIPKGRWTDIFTGFIYEGEKTVKLCRGLSDIPVLAKAGAIIPLSRDIENGVMLPKKLEVYIYRGNGSFDLIEDDVNKDDFEGTKLTTSFTLNDSHDQLIFTLKKPIGYQSLIGMRSYLFNFKDIKRAEIEVKVNGISTKHLTNESTVLLDVANTDEIEIILSNYEVLKNESFKERTQHYLSMIQGKNLPQMIKSFGYLKCQNDEEIKKYIEHHGFNKRAVDAAKELL